LDAGFLDLARQHCDAALKLPNPHENIGRLFTSLASFEESEKHRQDELLGSIQSRILHLQRLGRAATLAGPETIGEDWQGPECLLKLVRTGDTISLRGTYEREESQLLGLLGALGVSSTPDAKKSKYTVHYVGQIRGHAVVGEMKLERDDASLLAAAGNASQIFMILSDDENEFSVLKKANTNHPIPHVLRRVTCSKS
jgi:hypothetical protein